MRPLRILLAGIEPHTAVDEAMRIMQQQRIKDEIPDTLILVQHLEVVTLGPKAKRDGALEYPALADYSTTIVDRGGGMTYMDPANSSATQSSNGNRTSNPFAVSSTESRTGLWLLSQIVESKDIATRE